VRNAWRGLQCVALAALGTGMSSSTLAGDGLTAQGAQEFLATMAGQMTTYVTFVDAAGRKNYVTGKRTGQVKTLKGGLRKRTETIEALPEQPVDKQLSEIRASRLEAIDAYGRANGCATRITEVTSPPYDDSKSDIDSDNGSFTFKVTYTDQFWNYEPVAKFMNPAQVIDWSNAAISRNVHGVWVTSTGQGYATISLSFATADANAADHIEYAMKFLILSCGDGAGI
jgi:hypothetical protein